MDGITKHEILNCPRCGSAFECKANSPGKCQCAGAHLNLNELQYVAEQHDTCLCITCLMQLQQDYQGLLN